MADIDISPRREKETFHGDAGSVPSLVFKVVRMKMLNQFMKARLFARSLRHSRAAQRRAALMLLASLLCLVVLRQLMGRDGRDNYLLFAAERAIAGRAYKPFQIGYKPCGRVTPGFWGTWHP